MKNENKQLDTDPFDIQEIKIMGQYFIFNFSS